MEHGRGTQTGIVCLWRYANTKAQKDKGKHSVAKSFHCFLAWTLGFLPHAKEYHVFPVPKTSSGYPSGLVARH